MQKRVFMCNNVIFIRAIAGATAVAIAFHCHPVVMLDPVVNQSKIVLCIEPETHSVDVPF